jgi:IS5 family transposase
MRTKSTSEFYFDFSGESSIKVAKEYRARYEAISRLLEANPGLLTLAHRDWVKLLSTSAQGRAGYTSEQLLRALLVMFVEGDSYRDVVIRIDHSEFLRHFVRLGVKPTMDFTFLNKAGGVLSAPTVEAMNQALSRYARQAGKISGHQQRLDTTVYETNIHYPTDSSLLWDSFRTLARLLRGVRKDLPQLGLQHRFHELKVKKLATFIARHAAQKSKSTRRAVRRHYRRLIQSVRWIHGVGVEVWRQVVSGGHDAAELRHYLPLVARIMEQARQRVLEGLMLPPDEKLYSLFEEHTELMQRGKAGKPVEFGHQILLAQTGEKFIHYYQVPAQRIADPQLLPPALQAHRALFDAYPDVLSTDKGFYQSMAQIAALEKIIATVSIAKKGRRNADEYARETTAEFIAGQRFRAGVEGSISVLKRAFKLGKCFFKGFKRYAASVGLAVLCHNLVLLTRL